MRRVDQRLERGLCCAPASHRSRRHFASSPELAVVHAPAAADLRASAWPLNQRLDVLQRALAAERTNFQRSVLLDRCSWELVATDGPVLRQKYTSGRSPPWCFVSSPDRRGAVLSAPSMSRLREPGRPPASRSRCGFTTSVGSLRHIVEARKPWLTALMFRAGARCRACAHARALSWQMISARGTHDRSSAGLAFTGANFWSEGRRVARIESGRRGHGSSACFPTVINLFRRTKATSGC